MASSVKSSGTGVSRRSKETEQPTRRPNRYTEEELQRKNRQQQQNNNIRQQPANAENPTTTLQAEVAPDLDDAIQQAVDDALRQRDQQIVTAAAVASSTNNNNNNNKSGDNEGDESVEEGDPQRQKQVLVGCVGFIMLIAIIVLAVTLSGKDKNSTYNASTIGGTNEAPPSSSTNTGLEEAPSHAHSKGEEQLDPSLLGECSVAMPIDTSTGLQTTTFTNEFVVSTHVNEECGVTVQDRGIWFRFLFDSSSSSNHHQVNAKMAQVDVSNQEFSAKVSIYSGPSWEELACLDSTTSSALSTRSLTVPIIQEGDAPPEHYYLFIAGNGAGQVGTFDVKIQMSNGTLPPSVEPIATPTKAPTPLPTMTPTAPTTQPPTENPSKAPTSAPTNSPSRSPSKRPTLRPTIAPTISPSEAPVSLPPMVEPPANSVCSGATNIPSFGFIGTKLGGDTRNSVPSHTEASCGVTDQSRGVWFQLPNLGSYDGMVTYTVTQYNFNAKLSILWSASSDSDSCSSTLNCKWVQDCSGRSFCTTTLQITPGLTYFVLVSGSEEEAGGFLMEFRKVY